MKTILLFFTIALGALSVNAQTSGSKNTPAPVLEAFKKLYPSVAKVKWEKEDANYEATFKNGEKEQSLVFSPGGQLLETEAEISFAELPQAVRQYLDTHHKGKKVKEAAKITDAAGVVTYEVEIDGKDILFDSTGKVL